MMPVCAKQGNTVSKELQLQSEGLRVGRREACPPHAPAPSELTQTVVTLSELTDWCNHLIHQYSQACLPEVLAHGSVSPYPLTSIKEMPASLSVTERCLHCFLDGSYARKVLSLQGKRYCNPSCLKFL